MRYRRSHRYARYKWQRRVCTHTIHTETTQYTLCTYTNAYAYIYHRHMCVFVYIYIYLFYIFICFYIYVFIFNLLFLYNRLYCTSTPQVSSAKSQSLLFSCPLFFIFLSELRYPPLFPFKKCE